MRASMWMVLAASGSRRRRRLGLMSMVSILGCSLNVVVRRHTGGTSTLSKPSGCRHGTLIWSVYGVKGLASLDPFLGAPAISGAGKRYRSCGVVGLTVVLSAVRVRISADLDRRSLLSVGADFWWSARGALFSVALELLAVHWYVWLLWLWWLD